MFTSAIKKQTSVCCSISLNPYMVFQTWKSEIMEEEKKKKGKQFYLLLPNCTQGMFKTDTNITITLFLRALVLFDARVFHLCPPVIFMPEA